MVPFVVAVLLLVATSAGAQEDVSAAEMGVTGEDVSAVHDVIRQLRAPNVCFERTEHGFWTYAFCPALAKAPVRQYHGGDGRFTHLTAQQKYALGDALVSFAVTPKFLALHYAGGDRCDSGVVRSAEVRLVCNPRMRGSSVNQYGALVEVSEVKQCTYRVTLETPLTCDLRFYAAQLDSTHATKASLATASLRTSSATALPPTPPAPRSMATLSTVSAVDGDRDDDDAATDDDDAAGDASSEPLRTYEHKFNVRRVPVSLTPRRTASSKSWLDGWL